MSRFSLAVVASFLLASASALVSTPTAYGVGKEGFNKFRAALPKDFNVVAEGGYYALQQRYNAEVGKDNFSKLTLPSEFNVVSVGGYDNLIKLAADPKAELVQLVKENLTSTGGSGAFIEEGKLDALVALLQSQGSGFSSVKVDGEWSEVLSRQGKKSRSSQKIIAKAPRQDRPSSNFNVQSLSFDNMVLTPRGNGVLNASVKYTPIAKNFDKTNDGKIVLRRIACDIVGATFKYKFFPKLSLPFLKKKGGFLDFLYMDNDIRITQGNLGGTFIHFRPDFLEKVMA
mmetsp:Transcript_28182/g.43175  ORF Transcript_28182/g.43175 Transcript_28182/m.43175 type:complete len:286 (+) Transcript_28182:63-920(+)